ncbi:hypothetical protein CDAR_82751 [Caerostris darwini]|uniref:Uncharacterized protein n=1 Tax=Caerostris darwini TaxID=1538125 RepID=A0AAV4U897_9ARAC|nr:hypothetical protein CDAR_82751 [Caerostris darwini]
MPIWRSLILLRIPTLFHTKRQGDHFFDKPSKVKAVAPGDGFEKQKVLKCLENPCSKFLWNIHLKLHRTHRGKSKTCFSTVSKLLPFILTIPRNVIKHYSTIQRRGHRCQQRSEHLLKKDYFCMHAFHLIVANEVRRSNVFVGNGDDGEKKKSKGMSRLFY